MGVSIKLKSAASQEYSHPLDGDLAVLASCHRHAEALFDHRHGVRASSVLAMVAVEEGVIDLLALHFHHLGPLVSRVSCTVAHNALGYAYVYWQRACMHHMVSSSVAPQACSLRNNGSSVAVASLLQAAAKDMVAVYDSDT